MLHIVLVGFYGICLAASMTCFVLAVNREMFGWALAFAGYSVLVFILLLLELLGTGVTA